MTTKLVGMKEFRQNLASYTRNSRTKNIRYIILKKNIPVLEVRPIDEKAFAREKFRLKLVEAHEQYKRGEYYSHEEVMKELGLD